MIILAVINQFQVMSSIEFNEKLMREYEKIGAA